MSVAQAILHPQRRIWLIIFAAVVLWHLLVFWAGQEVAPIFHRPRWIAPPAPVETLTPERLESLRKKWKKQSLLLGDSAKGKTTDEAPEDSRYFSDRNIRVDKETKAAQMETDPSKAEKKGSKDGQSAKREHVPALDRLGVPLPAAPKQPQMALNEKGNSERNRPQADQYVQEDDLETGAENLLNAQSSTHYAFIRRMREEISPLWQNRLGSVPPQKQLQPGRYETAAAVTLDRAGNVVRFELVKTSGVAGFDGAVESVFRKLKRFPHPPASLFENGARETTVTWMFSVNVSDGPGFSFDSPRRLYQ